MTPSTALTSETELGRILKDQPCLDELVEELDAWAERTNRERL